MTTGLDSQFAARPDFRVERRSPSTTQVSGIALRFSERVWGIDWAEHFPRALTTDGVVARYSNIEKAWPFIAANFAAVFEEAPGASPFLMSSNHAARNRYYEEFGDVFEFEHDDKSVGFLICTPVDWCTYYIRFVAVLPEYRGHKLFQKVLPVLFDVLKANGVERVEADTSPSNLAFVHIMNKFAFNVAGTVLSERWGALVRFTRLLDHKSEDVFLGQFCTGVRYQTRGRNNNNQRKGGHHEEEIRSFLPVVRRPREAGPVQAVDREGTRCAAIQKPCALHGQDRSACHSGSSR